ncbi:IclR family transcriptional regulator [Cupriavidus pauculus]|uniref:IclR family transcriptional regulator n=1 Tax=Cupriavidus pauculus TaxID=82633 RepID=A0A2N5C2R1_9BURK|nr:IclR family transcriptional regulator [Cupriavidus pauculus]PLP96498.1 IclR family transcriptional regulator [Cupriavidus pauculus]
MERGSDKSGASEGAQSIRRALAILRIVAAGQELGVRLVDVVASTGLSQPTVHRILRVLIEEGAAEQNPETRRYVIGNEVSLLGLARIARFPLRAAAEPYLQYLSETLGDTIFLTIANGDDSVCIGRWPGSYPVKVLSIDVGARRPLGVGVSGLVLLASKPDDELKAIVKRNAKRLAALKVDPVDLMERAHEARKQGYGYTAKGVVQGSRAVAVPVFDGSGAVVAGIAMATITERLPASRLSATVIEMQKQAEMLRQRIIEMGKSRI